MLILALRGAMCSMISHESIFNNPCGGTISLYANLKCQKNRLILLFATSYNRVMLQWQHIFGLHCQDKQQEAAIIILLSLQKLYKDEMF